jgi:hypothetical protein
MPPRKYEPQDPKARHAIASKAYVERYRDKRRAYERDLRARQKAEDSPTRAHRLAQAAEYRARTAEEAKTKRAARAADKYTKERAKLLADPGRHEAQKAKRAKAARFKSSGLTPELFEIQEITRSIKLKINELRNPKDDAICRAPKA